jgi:hypothetical protein
MNCAWLGSLSDRHRSGGALARSLGTAATLAASMLLLSGCLSIKSQSASQRAPGVISLNIEVCASDRDRNIYEECDPDGTDGTPQNTAETDSGNDAVEGELVGQILAGFRVPAGTIAPDGFFSAAQEVFFSKSETYTAALTSQFPPEEGQEWVGYLSTSKNINVDNEFSRKTTFRPEFTLPPQPGGQPLTGPIAWRAVVALRATNPDAPVTCTTTCSDSPPPARVPINLPAPVSDFGVLAGGTAQAGHGETATVSFPLRYLDGNTLGPQVFSVSATTNLPSTSATTSVSTVGAVPNSTNPVSVSVPVPPGTPLGNYTVTLAAAVGDPPVTRTNTATIQVVDKLAPAVRIGSPADGATFVQGQNVPADYSCSDELNGTGVRACSAPVANGSPIDTSTVGTKTFTVGASDHAGNAASLTRSYTVVAPPPRRIVVSLGFDFAAFRRFTTFSRMQVRPVPRGSRVRATCRVRGKKCPGKARKAFTKRNARGTVSLNKRYKRIRLRAGTKITVRVTKPGFIGAVKILTVRAAKRPKVVNRCLPAGGRRPQRRC